MKIAIPVANGQLCAHFGHCQQFELFSVDPVNKKILSRETLDPPFHEPGVLPRWLKENSATTIIAGGMGHRAQGFFDQYGIEVIVGAASDRPEAVVQAFLSGTLEQGSNLCDH